MGPYPEIDDSEPLVVGHKHVAGVADRHGINRPPQSGADKRERNSGRGARRVVSSRASGLSLVTLGAEHRIHREDARGAVVADRLRDHEGRERLEVLAKGAKIGRFVRVIELLEQRFLELPDELGELIGRVLARVAIDEGGDFGKCREVCDDLLTRIRPLDLRRPPITRRERGRWTCPSDAAAIGSGANMPNAFDSFTPSSSSTIRSTSANENGWTPSCSRARASV